MIPLKIDEDGNQIEPLNTKHPFMRGIMTFDDYNYKRLNEHILLKQLEVEE